MENMTELQLAVQLLTLAEMRRRMDIAGNMPPNLRQIAPRTQYVQEAFDEAKEIARVMAASPANPGRS